jgi:hypothetical protein
LDLTATPKLNSNVISYVDAAQLPRKLNETALKAIGKIHIVKLVGKQSVAKAHRKIDRSDHRKEQMEIFSVCST